MTFDALVAEPKVMPPPAALHAKLRAPPPHCGVEPPASNTAPVPLDTAAGSDTKTIGCCAAITAFRALTMPAPHCPATHAHSPLVGSVVGQVGTPAAPGGNAVALDSMRAISWAGVRLALTARISAAMPDTMGAEKLVPRLVLVSSV